MRLQVPPVLNSCSAVFCWCLPFVLSCFFSFSFFSVCLAVCSCLTLGQCFPMQGSSDPTSRNISRHAELLQPLGAETRPTSANPTSARWDFGDVTLGVKVCAAEERPASPPQQRECSGSLLSGKSLHPLSLPHSTPTHTLSSLLSTSGL